MSAEIKIQDMSDHLPGLRPSRQEVYDFLQGQVLGVIASLDETGQPQVATVAFSQTEHLEFVVGTDEHSRKAVNVEHDPRVAFVVTDPQRRFTVQLDGTARRLAKEEFEKYAETHFEKLPASAPFRDIEGQCYLLITPLWLRFSDCNPHPWVLTEFTPDQLTVE